MDEKFKELITDLLKDNMSIHTNLTGNRLEIKIMMRVERIEGYHSWSDDVEIASDIVDLSDIDPDMDYI